MHNTTDPIAILRAIVAERRILLSALNQSLNATSPKRQARIKELFDRAEKAASA